MDSSVVFLVGLTLTGTANISADRVKKSSELNEVLREFLALVPQEKLIGIVREYLEIDAEVQAIVEYVQSDAFKDLVKKVESIEDATKFYDFLHEAGLNIHSAVKMLQEATRLPPPVPEEHATNDKITGGIVGLIEDIKGILPINEIKALYHEKLEASPDLAKLIEHLKSTHFQNLINALRANEDFEKIVKIVEEAGIDVKQAAERLATLFGLETSESSVYEEPEDLSNIFQEFEALLPTEKKNEILVDHLVNDEGIGDAYGFLQSYEFKDLIRKSDKIDELKNVYDYLQEAGMDVCSQVHELAGVPIEELDSNYNSEKTTSGSSDRITSGADSYIADMKALVPLDKVEALHQEKLKTSPAFRKFVDYLMAPRFRILIDALLANEEFQKLLKISKERGINVEAVVDLYVTIIGLKFPESP